MKIKHNIIFILFFLAFVLIACDDMLQEDTFSDLPNENAKISKIINYEFGSEIPIGYDTYYYDTHGNLSQISYYNKENLILFKKYYYDEQLRLVMIKYWGTDTIDNTKHEEKSVTEYVYEGDNLAEEISTWMSENDSIQKGDTINLVKYVYESGKLKVSSHVHTSTGEYFNTIYEYNSKGQKSKELSPHDGSYVLFKYNQSGLLEEELSYTGYSKDFVSIRYIYDSKKRLTETLVNDTLVEKRIYEENQLGTVIYYHPAFIGEIWGRKEFIYQ